MRPTTFRRGCTSATGPISRRPGPAVRPWRTGLVGRFSGKPVCIFASPTARPDGAFGGLILLAVHLTSLDHWLREATSLAAGGVILCDGQGRILAPSSAVAAGGGAGTARAPQPLLDAGEKGVLYRDASGREMVGASVSLGENGWRLARQEPTATILAGYRRQSLWVALGALATVCLVTPLVLRLCRNLEKPLETLARYARELRTTGLRGKLRADAPKASCPGRSASFSRRFATWPGRCGPTSRRPSG